MGVGQSLSDVLRPAATELLRIQEYKSTREMIDCIMSVTRLLTRTLIESRTDGTLPGADEFLPALILVRDHHCYHSFYLSALLPLKGLGSE